jgi:hypothetical protein
MTIEEQLEVESSIELARIHYKDHKYSFLAISRGSSRGLAGLYVRLGKRAGNIYRFFSDCDGSITIIPKEGDSRVRIPDSYNVTLKTQSTITVDELEVMYRRS